MRRPHEENIFLKVVARRLERGWRQVHNQRAPSRVARCRGGDNIMHRSVGRVCSGADGSKGVQRGGGGGAITHQPTAAFVVISSQRCVIVVVLVLCLGCLLVGLVLFGVVRLHKQREQIRSVVEKQVNYPVK